ncbi:MAG TPA: SulP family inorganic anion transporter [Oculatellaceae cyanobacterium]
MTNSIEIPKDGLAGLKQNWKSDIVSGFILFLIALPLCLGIALASGVPPMAGIISAIVGGILVSQISGSFVTVNGPAAGLIVVVLSSVERLGGGGAGYHSTLAAITISGAILCVLGLCKAGKLGDFFPASVVHGMLAAIGVIIMAKQLPFVLGVKPPASEPLQLIADIPTMVGSLNPEIALIGLLSLVIMISHARMRNKIIKRIPAPIIVVVVAIALGSYFDLRDPHTDVIGHRTIYIDPKFLVSVPLHFLDGIKSPDYRQIASYQFWLSVFSITLVQGIESLLSCAAVDKLDPFKRNSNLSRDLAAVGFGSVLSGLIGGLPMIAEIVRSTANVANNARTRWSNFFHGFFMLVFVLTAATLINRIPLASLAALLVFTGYRLGSPKVFKETHEIGVDQTIIFLATLVGTLVTDLLIGVSIGIGTKLAIHLLKGAPISRLFTATVIVSTENENAYIVIIKDAAIFSNYLSLKIKLLEIPPRMHLTLDLSSAKLVDHTVMEHLHNFGENYSREGGQFTIIGLENHQSASAHPLAARRLC